MSETLYRKYRPKNFSQIVGQAHIVRTLSNALKNERLSQSYLFSGPRGTGKTSVARILAKTANCLARKTDSRSGLLVSCEKCSACRTIGAGQALDIIEIDAASHTGVDNIRELKETVSVASSALKYKVYIIDEVHMLSTGAFNALLKTLEEPPAHVVFVLATTEIHKIPETILSRCQRFDFSRLPIQNIIEKLSLIAKEEKVKIDQEALEMIAIAAEGGMRDAESLLGQIISLEDNRVTLREVEDILGSTDRQTSAEIARLVLEKNSTEAIKKINDLLIAGFDLEVFNKSLINYFRQLMLVKVNPDLEKYFSYEMPKEQVVKIINLAKKTELSDILSSLNLFLEAQNKISSFLLPQLPLEMAVIRATGHLPAPPDSLSAPKKKLFSSSPAPLQKQNSENASASPGTHAEEGEISTEEPSPDNACLDVAAVRHNWKKLLNDIKPFNHSLSALLSNCQVMKTEGQLLTLATAYDFYREKLNEPNNKLTVENVFSKILGARIQLEVLLDRSLAPQKEKEDEPEEKPKGEQSALLDSALEILGGKVVE